MYKLSEIKELIKMLDQSNLQELEIQNDNYRLLIRKPLVQQSTVVMPGPQSMAVSPATIHHSTQPIVVSANESNAITTPSHIESTQLHKITSPMVGTFYRATSPGASPFVNVGSKVTEKTVVCIVEAMKLMNDIEAEINGEIVEILVENGQLVEYGQPLFLVKLD
jgi:acetyl-CoA carboxylase biotin carboxyl carrier protein